MNDAPAPTAPAIAFRDFGTPAQDLGQWEVLQPAVPDPGPPMDGEAERPPLRKAVRLRLRTMPSSMHSLIEKKYGHEETFINEGQRKTQRVFTPDERQALLVDKSDWCWTDSENLVITAETEQAVDFYRRHLADPNVNIGDTLSLDGRLNPACKRRLFDLRPELIGWIQMTVRAMSVQQLIRGEDLTKNS